MNIEWKNLFSQEILKRGKAYYRNGRVLRMNSTRTDDNYDFLVFGSNRYKVSISIYEDSIANMQCHCPYAREGKRCKHMAAALFGLEENGDLKCKTAAKQTSVRSARKKIRVFPFRESEQAGNSENKNIEKAYTFYNFDKITADYEIYAETLEKAR